MRVGGGVWVGHNCKRVSKCPVSRSWNRCHQKKFFCELKDSEQKKV